MPKRFYILWLSAFYLVCNSLLAQELSAEVQVLTPQIQATNKQIYQTLETAITEFLNNRKWTDEKYEEEERINCQFILTINDRKSNSYLGRAATLL
ncbi:MAG: DUF4835 family protein [Owenweeksia sp.]|nr:DUF4835 family protein [Owenweeksia sp.]